MNQTTQTLESIDLTIDVTDAAGLGEPLSTKATVTLPDPAVLSAPPVVCFGFPGGGYSRQYFTFDMPDGSGGGQAGWHARRGWIFVSCDHLLVGESSAPSDPTQLTFGVVAAANAATVAGVTAALADGTLADGFPPVATRRSSASASRWVAASRSSSRDGTQRTTGSAYSASARSRPCCRFRPARRATPTCSRRATTVCPWSPGASTTTTSRPTWSTRTCAATPCGRACRPGARRRCHRARSR